MIPGLKPGQPGEEMRRNGSQSVRMDWEIARFAGFCPLEFWGNVYCPYVRHLSSRAQSMCHFSRKSEPVPTAVTLHEAIRNVGGLVS
jgi:hypothetical protein